MSQPHVPTPWSFFRVKKPCKNCPFLKEGAIRLAPGRMIEIVEHLLASDDHTFHCHETVHHDKFGGTWDDDTGEYTMSGRESHCAGASIYLQKQGMSSLWMRIGYAAGALNFQEVTEQADKVFDRPEDAKTS